MNLFLLMAVAMLLTCTLVGLIAMNKWHARDIAEIEETLRGKT